MANLAFGEQDSINFPEKSITFKLGKIIPLAITLKRTAVRSIGDYSSCVYKRRAFELRLKRSSQMSALMAWLLMLYFQAQGEMIGYTDN